MPAPPGESHVGIGTDSTCFWSLGRVGPFLSRSTFVEVRTARAKTMPVDEAIAYCCLLRLLTCNRTNEVRRLLHEPTLFELKQISVTSYV